jgi:hypothetical protein
MFLVFLTHTPEGKEQTLGSPENRETQESYF